MLLEECVGQFIVGEKTEPGKRMFAFFDTTMGKKIVNQFSQITEAGYASIGFRCIIRGPTLVSIDFEDHSTAHTTIQGLPKHRGRAKVANEVKVKGAVRGKGTRSILAEGVRDKSTTGATRLLNEADSLSPEVRIIPIRGVIINTEGHLTIQNAREGMTLIDAMSCIPDTLRSNPGLLMGPFIIAIGTIPLHTFPVSPER